MGVAYRRVSVLRPQRWNDLHFQLILGPPARDPRTGRAQFIVQM